MRSLPEWVPHRWRDAREQPRIERASRAASALKAPAALCSRVPNVGYLIVGDGPERAGLEQRAIDLESRNHVRFAGAVHADELPAYSAAADVFVHRNRAVANFDTQGFGLVFLEAAAAGRCVIGGRTGGVSEAGRRKHRLLASGESADGLGVAPTMLLVGRELRKRPGAAGRARDESGFTWQRAAQSVTSTTSRPWTASVNGWSRMGSDAAAQEAVTRWDRRLCTKLLMTDSTKDEPTVIRGISDMQDAYRDAGVAQTYISSRFARPLGQLLHRRQLAAIREAIVRARPSRVLELAPGPARLTADVAPLLSVSGIAIDSSREMLTEARTRLPRTATPGWHLLQGDAFNLPLQQTFDLAYTFRLIRHFEAAERAHLYSELARVLRPGGILIFDAVNSSPSTTLRSSRAGREHHRHYDALMTPEELRKELLAAGFDNITLKGVQPFYRLMYRIDVFFAPRAPRMGSWLLAILDRLGAWGEPLEWIVTCRRR